MAALPSQREMARDTLLLVSWPLDGSCVTGPEALVEHCYVQYVLEPQWLR